MTLHGDRKITDIVRNKHFDYTVRAPSYLTTDRRTSPKNRHIKHAKQIFMYLLICVFCILIEKIWYWICGQKTLDSR